MRTPQRVRIAGNPAGTSHEGNAMETAPRFIFVCREFPPIVAHAADRAAMRALVRARLGIAPADPLPRHAIASIR